MKKLLFVCLIFMLTSCDNSLVDRLTPGLIAKVGQHKIYLTDIKERAKEDNDKSIKLTKPILIFYLKEIIKEIIIEEEFKKFRLKINDADKKNAPFVKKFNEKELRRWLMFKKLKAYVVRKLTPPSSAECKAYYKAHIKDFNHSGKVELEYIVFEIKKDAEKFYNSVKKKGFDKSLKELRLQATYKGILNIENIPDDIKKQIDYTDKNSVWLIRSETKYYYVIKILNYYYKILPFKVIKNKISEKILEEKRRKLFNLWLEDKMKKRKITIYYDKLN